MSIIFRIQKYLNTHSKQTVIGIVLVTSIVLSVASLTGVQKYTSLYEAEKKISRKNEKTIAALKAAYEPLSDKNMQLNETLKEQETSLLKQRKKVKNLQGKVDSLLKRNKKLALKKADEVSSTGIKDTSYSHATVVWNKLRAQGLNNYVCAGILGNIMAEVGGQTLDISRWSKYPTSSPCYGICQWTDGRKERLINSFGSSLSAQVDFLSTELFEVIPEDSSFYSLQDEEEAALYFARYYERCSSEYYSVRQDNATKALKYFNNM